MRSLVVVLALLSTAVAAPPLVLKLGKKPDELNHTLRVANRSAKAVERFCWVAVYSERGELRIYEDCSDDVIAAKATVSLTVCPTCSNEIPPLSQLTLDYVVFADDTRWFTPGTAKPPKSGAPMAVSPTKLTHRYRGSDCNNCDTEKVWLLQNTTKKPISAYNFHYREPSGKENHMFVVTEEQPIAPGQTTYVYVNGDITDFTSISFSDKTSWEPRAK